MTTVRAALALLIATGAAAACALSPPPLDARCRVSHAEALLPDLPEASGLALSRRHDGIVWAHNDSGNEPFLFALDASGAVRARVRLSVRTRDWEDVSAASCPDGGACLYVGDIGDNSLARPHIVLYRLPEPSLGDAHAGRPEVLNVAYPDGPHNAEGMFITGNDLFIITKDPAGAVYRAPLRDGASEITLQRIGQLGVAMVTDAEASPDGRLVAVRTPDALLVYRTADLAAGGVPSPLLRTPVEALGEPQGEGVAIAADGTIYLASEGRPWQPDGRLVTLHCGIID